MTGALLVTAGCARGPEAPAAQTAGEPTAPAVSGAVRLDPPAAAGAFAPDLAVAGDRLFATWLEPADVGAGTGHRLLIAPLEGSTWGEPVVVAEGDDFFANWADFPSVVAAGDGSLVAHWLAKTGAETYAYSIFLARSTDGGASWTALGPLHDDGTPTEHGFVSWIAEDDGARAFWLDGREMVAGGAMTLRTARVGSTIGPAEVLDERVCECCATGAARAAGGPLVVYRDRDAAEIRDVSIVRLAGDWTLPAAVATDGWKIPGCPVNGPRVAAAGERVAVAWFTAAEQTPRVQLAFSSDGGASFGPARVLDEDVPLGRTDVVLDAGGDAWVVWLANAGDHAAVRLQRSPLTGPSPEPIVVGETAAGRTSGFPRLARIGDGLFVAWVEIAIADDAPSRVRVARVAAG